MQCQQRWAKVVNPELIKGPWTKEEDEKVIELVRKYGPKKWTLIARFLKGRIGKQCRERWHNHLNPNIKKTAWTEEEDKIIYQAHQQWGNQWAKIAKLLPGEYLNAPIAMEPSLIIIFRTYGQCNKKSLEFDYAKKI